MEFDLTSSGLEDHLAESRKKIENLTKMVQNLSDSKKKSNGNDSLRRIEAKLDIIAETDASKYIDLFIENLKTDLEEKQSNLDLKITSIEEITGQINNLLKNQTLEQVFTNELGNLKTETDSLMKEIAQIQNKITHTNNQISELTENTHQTKDLISNISDNETLEELKALAGSLDNKVNNTISTISELDTNIKIISDNLEGLIASDNNDSIKKEVTKVSEQINSAVQILKSASTASDVALLKADLLQIGKKIDDIFNNSDSYPKASDIADLKYDISCINSRFEEIRYQINFTSNSVNSNVDKALLDVSSQINQVVEKFDGVFDILNSSSTASDIESLRNEIDNLNLKFTEIHNHVNFCIEQIKESSIQSLEPIDVNVNSILAVLSSMDIRIKAIYDEIDKKSFLEEINPLKNDLSEISDKINLLTEALEGTSKAGEAFLLDKFSAISETLGLTSTVDDVELLKADLLQIGKKIDDIFNNSDSYPKASDIADLKYDISCINSRFEEIRYQINFTSNSVNSNVDKALLDVSSQINQVVEKFDGVFDILNSSSTASDIESLRNEIDNLNLKFTEIHNHVNFCIDQIKESSIQSLEPIDVNVNSILAVLSSMDIRIKAIYDEMDEKSFLEEINPLKNDLSEISDKINLLTEVLEGTSKAGEAFLLDKFSAISKMLGLTSTVDDVESVRNELTVVSTKLGELQDHINSSSSAVKENSKSFIDSLELNVNAVLSALSIMDMKVKTISDNIEHLPSSINNIDTIKSEITELSERINGVFGGLNLAVKDELNELKNSVNDLYLKDDTGPVLANMEHVKAALNEIETLAKNSFEPKISRIHDELCISQDRLSIAISNLIRPVKDELFHLNEGIFDLKEYFAFQNKDTTENRTELAIIAERFNDIWTSAGLTIDKLGDQVAITEESTEKLLDTVDRFFETSEETNLITTNVLKKTSEISNNLTEINNDLGNKIENLNNILDNETQKMHTSIAKGNLELSGKLMSAIENDFNFMRSDMLEFKEKQERFLEDSMANQDTIQNSLSNLHFSVTDSSDLIIKRINDLAFNLDKLHNLSSGTLSTSEIVKDSLIHIAGWIDSAERMLVETSSNVKEIRKNNEVRKILAELLIVRDNIIKNSNSLGNISAKIENDLSETKKELKATLNVIKKRQECDFDSINTNISGISQEVSGIVQAFANFENKIKLDLKLINHTLSENSNQNGDIFQLDQFESSIQEMKKEVNIELRKINDKFTRMENKLGSIEAKLSRLEDQKLVNDDNQDIRRMLEFITNQVTSEGGSGKGNIVLLKKINSIERRMADFDSNIQKVVSFLSDD